MISSSWAARPGATATLERSYLVGTGARGDVMTPMVAQICVNVDVASKHIMVALPDGLIEVNATSGRRPADRGERRAHSDPSTGSGSPRATSRGGGKSISSPSSPGGGR